MLPIDQQYLIIEGFKPGKALLWNVSGNSFAVSGKTDAKKLGKKGYEVTLDKVSIHVEGFFKAHPELRSTEVLETIRARVAPYQGWFGWVLWLSFRYRFLNQILTHFNFLTQSVCDGPLVPVPESGIRMGISNLGNSCWFNAVLKFLASTTVLDYGFNNNNFEMSKLFRVAINELRLGRAGNLDHETLRRLRVMVEAQFEDFRFDVQCDSDEFIRAFIGQIWAPAGNSVKALPDHHEELVRFFSECTSEFTPTDDSAVQAPTSELTPAEGSAAKAPTSDQFTGCVILHLDEEDLRGKGQINLSDVLSKVSHFDTPIAADNGVRRNFSRKQMFTHLPQNLLLNLQRGVRVGGNLSGRDEKCCRPIALDANSTLTFPLYQVQEGRLVHVEDKVYRVDAAITHEGDIHKGHYVCDTRNTDGSVTHHDDLNVLSTENPIGRSAVFFYLTLIS